MEVPKANMEKILLTIYCLQKIMLEPNLQDVGATVYCQQDFLGLSTILKFAAINFGVTACCPLTTEKAKKIANGDWNPILEHLHRDLHFPSLLPSGCTYPDGWLLKIVTKDEVNEIQVLLPARSVGECFHSYLFAVCSVVGPSLNEAILTHCCFLHGYQQGRGQDLHYDWPWGWLSVCLSCGGGYHPG